MVSGDAARAAEKTTSPIGLCKRFRDVEERERESEGQVSSCMYKGAVYRNLLSVHQFLPVTAGGRFDNVTQTISTPSTGLRYRLL